MELWNAEAGESFVMTVTGRGVSVFPDSDVRVSLDEGAHMPERAHEEDAGADLRTREDLVVPPHGSAVTDTGVHVELPRGTAGVLVSKSGLNVREDMTTTGLIDSGYTGPIVVKVYNHGDEERVIRAGEKVSQLVIVPVLCPRFSEVGEIGGGARGDAGFGSTGRS